MNMGVNGSVCSTSCVQYTGLLHRSCRWVHLASLPAINDVWAGPIWVKSMQAESDAGCKSSQGISWSYCGVWYGTGQTFQRGKIYSESLELYQSLCSDIVFAIIHGTVTFNPFTPESDQFQISPAASPEILHHTVWRTWLFIAYSDERWLYYQFSLPHLYIFSIKG